MHNIVLSGGLIERLFNGAVESLFGSDPSGTIQRTGGTTFLIVGSLVLVFLGAGAIIHYAKTKKFDKTFWLYVAGAILGGVLAIGGLSLLSSLSQTVNNNL